MGRYAPQSPRLAPVPSGSKLVQLEATIYHALHDLSETSEVIDLRQYVMARYLSQTKRDSLPVKNRGEIGSAALHDVLEIE